jgi:hypothetical protein
MLVVYDREHNGICVGVFDTKDEVAKCLRVDRKTATNMFKPDSRTRYEGIVLEVYKYKLIDKDTGKCLGKFKHKQEIADLLGLHFNTVVKMLKYHARYAIEEIEELEGDDEDEA